MFFNDERCLDYLLVLHNLYDGGILIFVVFECLNLDVIVCFAIGCIRFIGYLILMVLGGCFPFAVMNCGTD